MSGRTSTDSGAKRPKAAHRKPAHKKSRRKAQQPEATKAVQPTPEPHPRIVARREQVQHRTRSATAKALRIGATCVAAVGVLIAIALSPLFAVRTVTVHGQIHESAAAITSAAAVSGSPSMVTLDSAAVAARVNALPWIATTSVSRQWPSTLSIVVTERHPVGYLVGVAGISALVDATGRVLAYEPGTPTNVPRLIAPVHLVAPGSSVGVGGAPALLVAATLPVAFKDQVRAVTARGGSVSLSMDAPVTFFLGPPVGLGAKYEAVAAVIAKEPLHAGDVIDVSVPQSITITHG